MTAVEGVPAGGASLDLPYLVALTGIRGLGSRHIRTLVGRLGTARAVWEAPVKELRAGDVSQEAVAALLAARSRGLPGAAAAVPRALAKGYQVVSYRDHGYPRWLADLEDAPLVLYLWGSILPEDQKAVAVVGTRQASPYGLGVAERLARSLAAAGLTIVSGLARGIDTAAHRGALAAGGRTIAVLGSGLDRLYPADNRTLATHVARAGAVMSEYSPWVEPRGYFFPHRNRIIAGMSLGVLVVEAGRRSGAITTADHALVQGKPVMAVPGPVTSPSSCGCNRLIRDGAHLVECAEDVLAVLGTEAVVRHRLPLLDEAEAGVLDLLQGECSHSELLAQSGLEAGELAATLLSLEMQGLIRRLPGQTYIRVC